MRRDQIEELFYGKPEQQRRFTQDFPILPDVWIAYGREPDKRIELLLTPHNESDAPRLAQALRYRLQMDRSASGSRGRARRSAEERPRVLFNESVVLASLSFREMVRDAMPLTDWWKRVVAPIGGEWKRDALKAFASTLAQSSGSTGSDRRSASYDPRLLQKLIRIVGCLELERQKKPTPATMIADTTPTKPEVDAFAGVFDDLQPAAPEGVGTLWSISLNREAKTSVWRSRLTVKADAAARLFVAETAGIRWAVLDTGIDATHRAFARRDASQKIGPHPFDDQGELNSRVLKTYNFLRIKELLDPDAKLSLKGTAAARMDRVKLEQLRADLSNSLLRGRSIDWDLLEPFLRIPHTKDDYSPPKFDSHGTHVAGILAANWQEAAEESPLKGPLIGMCPELELYDLRVLPDNPADSADEFTIIAALQFVRHLNAHKNLMVIHGVNLSLSIPHDVANYACGRTPVCDECERVVSSGVIVVTAAGNRGFNKLRDAEGGATGDYRYISITDPGNAEGVITVGSTHRMMPHNYGVSYFSSRGPTGDGRTKPDLIAPGERIDSSSLEGYYETMDGTSMAAPHVSGAAALLIGRHRELIGDPQLVKKVLCDSATDLGREPRFQGHGIVDVLRAMQSI
jgi:subtilisin family serine protease